MSEHKNLKQVNLNSNIANGAKFLSDFTSNPWGIITIKRDIWAASNNTASLVKYSRRGEFLFSADTTGAPTGLVKNFSAYFGAYNLITVTLNGGVEGYNPITNPASTTVILNVTNGILTSCVIANNKLFITNFADTSVGGGVVLIYDSNFNFVNSFTDTALVSAGFFPYSLTFYKKYLYVAFAKKDGASPVVGEGFGYINSYRLDGSFVRRVVNRTGLNAPSAMIVDKCGKHLYVGNFGDGTTSIYKLKCGNYVGQVRDCYSNILYIDGLQGFAYDCSDDILFSAGIDDQANGLIGKLTSCEEKCEKKCKPKKSCKSSTSSCKSSSTDDCRRRC